MQPSEQPCGCGTEGNGREGAATAPVLLHLVGRVDEASCNPAHWIEVLHLRKDYRAVADLRASGACRTGRLDVGGSNRAAGACRLRLDPPYPWRNRVGCVSRRRNAPQEKRPGDRPSLRWCMARMEGLSACGRSARLRRLSNQPFGCRRFESAGLGAMKKARWSTGPLYLDGAHGRIRTSDRLVRSQVLYPTELHAQIRGRDSPACAGACQSVTSTHRSNMAEREGFEPSIEFPLDTLSRGAPSATRPSLQ